jgi:tetratricopeptide (TPR) repeat protein
LSNMSSKNQFFLIAFFSLIVSISGRAQDDYLLIADTDVQIDATEALNDMYNFKFDEASMQFRWLKNHHEDHPLPYLLLALNEWWRIMPNLAVESYDEKFLGYIETTIEKAETLYDIDSTKIEGAFFLATSWGFKARLLSERRSWLKAAHATNKSLRYLDDCRRKEELSPELMFGDALYNYFSVWIPDNYPQLKPFLVFFEKGEKEVGLQQLRQVARNAFYTRTEAQYWLMRILFNEENDHENALQVAEYLHETFPDNAYFHRYYARMLYSMGKLVRAKLVSEDLLHKIDSGYLGYEETSGRYACFFLGQIWESNMDQEKALEYYQRAVDFGEEIEAYESGYFLYSLVGIARIYNRQGNTKKAKEYLKLVKKHAKRKHPAHKAAREFLKSI